MKTFDTKKFIAPEVESIMQQDENSGFELLPPFPDSFADEWQKVIDYKLIEWGRNPSLLEDEGIEPPSREVIAMAIDFAKAFKTNGFPTPDYIVPDPSGGIIFERKEGTITEIFHIWDDQSIEYLIMDGNEISKRYWV